MFVESNLPHHRIPAEENIHTGFLVVVDQVAPNRTFPVAKNNNPRTKTTMNFVALRNERWYTNRVVHTTLRHVYSRVNMP